MAEQDGESETHTRHTDRPFDLTRASERIRVSRAAVRSMRRVADEWSLTDDEAARLLGPTTDDWLAVEAEPPLDWGQDVLIRVSHVLGIWTALMRLHEPALARAWMTRRNSNDLFAGQRPIDLAMSGGLPAIEMIKTLLNSRTA